MMTVENGLFVKACYSGKLADSEEEVYSDERNCQSIEFQVGSGDVLKAFEEAMIGMAPKETRTFILGPEEAYGERDTRLERTFSRSALPSDFNARKDELIALQTDKGDQVLATVKRVNDEEVTLDLNHPLAGKTILFEVQVEEVSDHPVGSM
jgi:peptidylprolyl isomerase